MSFLLRLMVYVLMSIPFGLLSWLFIDLTQRLAYSVPFWRIPDPANILPALFALSAFLPWIVAAAVIAGIEANQSRSIALTAVATAAFWGAATMFATGATTLPGVQRFVGVGPESLPHQVVRFLPDWLSPTGMFGHHMMSVPGYWHLSALIVPLFMIGMLVAVIAGVVLVISMLQRRMV